MGEFGVRGERWFKVEIHMRPCIPAYWISRVIFDIVVSPSLDYISNKKEVIFLIPYIIASENSFIFLWCRYPRGIFVQRELKKRD